MLRLRLIRTGKRNRPHYRLAAMDARAQRDGRAVEYLGHYDPYKETDALQMNRERVVFWLDKGAQPTESVEKLLRKQGIYVRK